MINGDDIPVSQSLKKSIPRSLKKLSLSRYDAENLAPLFTNVMELVAEKDTSAPGLESIDLGWLETKCPNFESPRPNQLCHYSGLTQVEAHALLDKCRSMGVGMVIGVLPPQPKTLTWTDEVGGEDKLRSKTFHYPFDGYDTYRRYVTGF